MPLYTISTDEPLAPEAKLAAAKMITDTHCGHTGAPRTFVNVLYYQNVPLRPGVKLDIFGSVRGGRTLEANNNIERDMVARMATIAGYQSHEIEFSYIEVSASWIMEGGAVLPEPGEEEAWLAKHHPEAQAVPATR